MKEPRIPPLPREEWTDDAREVFAYWEGEAARENGSRSVTIMTLANHPELAIPQLDFGKYMLTKSLLTPRQKELVILRIAWRYGSGYQWGHHVHSGRLIGMTDADFEALQSSDSSHWNDEEAAMVAAVDQLCDTGRIDDATWSSLAAAMNRRELMDLLYSIGFFAMNAWAFGAMGIELEPEFESFSTPAEQLVAEKDGSAAPQR